MENKFYVIGTPIGNLEDITKRAERVLSEVDIILAEDTRVTKKILNVLGIKKQIWRYDEHIHKKISPKILEFLEKGYTFGMVVDAGTPNISDPGSLLISYLRKSNPQIKIIPIPGPSALVTALSVSGMPANHFTFLGYPPYKKGRNKFFKELNEIKWRPIVIFESPHRLIKTFDDLENITQIKSNLVVTKELTKIYEEIWEGNIKEAKVYFQKEKLKGEFVIILP
jgi:16S rRNA (cytidine1402-2'-O)-methyltransferase